MSKLLEEILSDDNIAKAIKVVKSRKGASGIDHMSIYELDDYFKDNLSNIKNLIRKRKYKPLPVKRVEIPKPDGSKRPLGIPCVKDRVLQQAIYQVLSPMCEKVFNDSSYGFRPNRSCENAIIKTLEYFNDGYDWLVDLDLSKFFDNVDQNILMILVHDIIKDGDTESLIRKYLISGVSIGGTIHDTTKGTPQGGNLSPLLANIYLNQFDRELERRGLHFTRYADDCVICLKSEAAANRVMKSVTKWLKEKLKVEVNVTKTKVSRPQGIKYLGFGFYRRKDGTYRPKPHVKSIEKLKFKLRQLTVRRYSTSILARIERINMVTRGWINYFKICDMKGWMKTIDRHLRFRLRMIIWKQWKTPQNRVRQLRKCGLPEWIARAYGNSRKGIARCASTFMLRAITTETFNKSGLVSLPDHYNLVHNY